MVGPPPAGWQLDAEALDAAIPDLDWRRLPDGAERDVFDAPSGPLARIAMGPVDGQRVVLIPGATGSKEDFVLMLPLLADAGYRVESFDLAGQYESSEAGPWRLDPPRESYDEQLFLDDVLAVLDAGSPAAHVLGYSFAGTLAQLALAARPDRFASLALLSCPPEVGQAFRTVKRIGPLSTLTNAHQGAALMLWGIRNNLNKVPPGRLAFVRERFALTHRQSVDDIIALMMATPDVRAEVAASPVPKLVAVGAHDLWPLERHEAFAEEIGAQVAVYATGHSPCETAPHQLVRDLLALYARS
ncbi:alpha/beta hydrolase [Agromyces intestinalis]|uniref:Alpha/beta hydrolase n=1 Tax=Agromyces intestinalis TaxID=2592652 RepID=A0A5C1YLI3_9MICO|nr:alpha/beta fold hydrolase [Agromyces intestinalis]QEO16019.1 alpha/beta hydrolase [Agromyces intestinalis]